MDTTSHSFARDERHHHNEHEGTAGNVRRVTPVQAVQPVEFGTGWYHDAAIDEARREAIEARCNPYR